MAQRVTSHGASPVRSVRWYSVSSGEAMHVRIRKIHVTRATIAAVDDDAGSYRHRKSHSRGAEGGEALVYGGLLLAAGVELLTA